jgi:hypothetical protein
MKIKLLIDHMFVSAFFYVYTLLYPISAGFAYVSVHAFVTLNALVFGECLTVL